MGIPEYVGLMYRKPSETVDGLDVVVVKSGYLINFIGIDLFGKPFGFGEITGVPVLLNTSFNENEPIVNTPQEALDCFLRTEMDVLVMGSYLLVKDEKRSLTTEAQRTQKI